MSFLGLVQLQDYESTTGTQQDFGCIQAYSSPSLALRYGSVHITCLELGGYPESGRAIHRAEDLVGDFVRDIQSDRAIKI